MPSDVEIMSRPIAPEAPPRLSIAVQDRQRLFREGVALILAGEPDLDVAVTAATASELVSATAERNVALVILELDVDAWDACRLAAALQNRHEGLTVIGTLAGDGTALPVRAYQAGIRTVFARNAGVRTLLQTIRNLPVPRRTAVTDHTIRLERRHPTLSGRELEVLGAIGSGATTADVALAMGISPKTVENHKQRIFSKLGVQNQAHAVAVAMRHGLLVLPAA